MPLKKSNAKKKTKRAKGGTKEAGLSSKTPEQAVNKVSALYNAMDDKKEPFDCQPRVLHVRVSRHIRCTTPAAKNHSGDVCSPRCAWEGIVTHRDGHSVVSFNAFIIACDIETHLGAIINAAEELFGKTKLELETLTVYVDFISAPPKLFVE
ncbi:hypothetical protein H0H81_008474 [Sphagnurus paluster]|uniref:Uncharacterized protein n=1 Tax=Sphagnurus paluster TaxID=117069 RepID=A0A9P7FU44_9AGAR|nr:hypothetical protein H0H81_008474 [Sphagnurus paluster]